MPEICRFFGIIVRMFVEAGGSHHLPHFHAYYQDDIAIYGIARIERIAGSFPTRQERLVLAWGGTSSTGIDGELGHVARGPSTH
jgi:hypothetical protein